MSAFDVVNNRDLTVWSFVANNLVETPLSFRLPKEEKKKKDPIVGHRLAYVQINNIQRTLK
jgi:hypothetical protein